MSKNSPNAGVKNINNRRSREAFLYTARLRNSLWLFGIPTLLFVIADRSMTALADGYLTTLELSQVFVTSFLFVSWLCLSPNKSLSRDDLRTFQSYKPNSNLNQHKDELCTIAQARMLEMQKEHLISQEYILPFPYICQIYHLLNLRHLENIHSFSLGKLKVIQVSNFHPTAIGGRLRFQTTLDSQINALRIWRRPIVEVELVLHTPYTVELQIPVYNNKNITVIFNVLPTNLNEHKLFIDIYSNLKWPKPLLQILLHIAACLTLFEDLPYLRKLARRNLHCLVNSNRGSDHKTWLYTRFVNLYGKSISQDLQPVPSNF